MSSLIKVTPEQLAELSGRVRAGAGTINGELSGLTGAVAPLRADWAGAASSNFEGLWQQWQHGAQQLNEALGGIADLLGQAGRAYAEAEQSIAATFRG